jgi:glycosyltransferase involved in cell wall biosynthesis
MTRAFNVIFMGNFLYPNGMAEAKRIQHLADYLRENGVSVKILLLRQGGVTIPEPELEGVHNQTPYKTIGNNVVAAPSLLFTLPGFFVSGIATLFSWKQKGAKNVLYCYGGPSIENLLFILLGKLIGYRIVFDIVEDNTFFEEKMHPLAKMKMFASELLDKAVPALGDAIVVISRYLKKIYEEQAGNQLPVVLIPVTAQKNESEAVKSGDGVLRVVYSGSYAKKDGVDLLVSAFEKFQERNKNAQLILTGKGANQAALKERVTNDAIRFTGYLEDGEYFRLLREADVLCMTRTGSAYANAGFPFKLGEYLASGNPVIVTNVSDVSAYLENMKDAIIIEPDSVDEIYRALEYCRQNPEAVTRIGESGRRKCEMYFSPAAGGKTLLDLLHGMER